MSASGIRLMEPKDIDRVVNIHLMAFPGFFLSFLGPAFLRELYKGILHDTSGIAHVYQGDTQILGFVAGSDEAIGLYRRLLRTRWWRFGLAATKAIMKKPAVIRSLSQRLQTSMRGNLPNGTGILISIGVDPEMQGRGIGKKLVGSFLEESCRRRLNWVTLTTDRVSNDSVNIFYQSLGFTLYRSYDTSEGRSMNEYLIRLGV